MATGLLTGPQRRVREYPETPVVGYVIVISLAPPTLAHPATFQMVCEAWSSTIPVLDSFPQRTLLSGRTITYTSSNPALATVSATGLVTTVAAGSPSITARCEGVDAPPVVFTITSPTQNPVATLEVTPVSFSLNVGESRTLSAAPRDSGGNFVAGVTGIVWSSNLPSVCSVGADSGNDAHTVIVTALAVGTCTISATKGVITDSSAGTIAAAGTLDGFAELPRVRPTIPYNPPTGGVLHTPADANELWTLNTGGTLNGNTLQRGDIVQLTLGVLYNTTTRPQHTFPAITGQRGGTSSDWIYVRTSGLASIPAGQRVSAASTAYMPLFSQINGGGYPPLRLAWNADRYAFVGIEIDAGAVTVTSRLFEVGILQAPSIADQPDNILIDRCYMSAARANKCTRALLLNCRTIEVRDTLIEVEASPGLENQATGGWETTGPVHYNNCRLVAGGENIMFGGAPKAGGVGGTCAADITVRRCHLYKPLTWNQHHPTFDGVDCVEKNNFELKWGIRVLVEECVLENMWTPDQQYMVNIKCNPLNGDTSVFTLDVVFRNCKMIFMPNLFNVTRGSGAPGPQYTQRVTLRNILALGLNAPYTAAGAPTASGGKLASLSVDKLTIKNVTAVGYSATVGTIFANDATNCTNTVVWDCIVTRGTYGIKFSGHLEGNDSLNANNPGHSVRRNAFIGANPANYPADNTFPPTVLAAGFVNSGAGNYRLLPTSMLKGTATDGGDPGADIDLIETLTAGCVTGVWP